MKRCTQCGTIHSDTEEPFIFCVRCGSHKWEPVGDELPFGESEQSEETNREALIAAMMDDDERDGLYEEIFDEYLDRLIKQASPAWEGVDLDAWLMEVRGYEEKQITKPMRPDVIQAARSVYGPIIDMINKGGRFLVVWPDLLPFVVNDIDPDKHFVTGMVIVDLTQMLYTVNGADWFALVLEE